MDKPHFVRYVKLKIYTHLIDKGWNTTEARRYKASFIFTMASIALQCQLLYTPKLHFASEQSKKYITKTYNKHLRYLNYVYVVIPNENFIRQYITWNMNMRLSNSKMLLSPQNQYRCKARCKKDIDHFFTNLRKRRIIRLIPIYYTLLKSAACIPEELGFEVISFL